MEKQVLKIGNSLGLTLPPSETRRLKLKPGDLVELKPEGDGILILPQSRLKKIRLGGIWQGQDLSYEEIQEARDQAWQKIKNL